MMLSDIKPWYVGKLIPGVGYPVRAQDFIDEQRDRDFVRAVCSDEDTAKEIVEAHNAHDHVKRNIEIAQESAKADVPWRL